MSIIASMTTDSMTRDSRGRDGRRPGGRSARIQAAVHQAVDDLLAETERGQLTIPLIAARAGVTPSTIYRRWGELAELMADVALQRLRPDGLPPDGGGLAADLLLWFSHYAEELSSVPGRAMLRDLIAADPDSGRIARCCLYTSDQLMVILARAAARGEAAPDLELLIDQVVAPILYRILFSGEAVGPDVCRRLIDRTLRLSRPPAAISNQEMA